MVDVANDDILAAHFDGDDALARDGSLAIVGKSDVLVVDTMAGDEGLVGVPEMVGGSAIEDCHFSVGVCGCGKDFGWARRDYLCESGRDSWWTRRGPCPRWESCYFRRQ